MPTDQKLDPEAEARIREACVNLRGGFATCLCRDLRAAILADREARVHDGGVDWGRDEMQQERAHADALAEMIRVLRDELDAYRSRTRECPCCDAPVQPHEDGDTAHLPDCAWVRSDDLLAAHYRTRS